MDDQNNPIVPAQDGYQSAEPSMTPPPHASIDPVPSTGTPFPSPMTETTPPVTTTTTVLPQVPGDMPQTTTTTTAPAAITTTTTAPTSLPTTPQAADVQWPETKPKSNVPKVLGGIAAIILVVGVATAAYFVSNRISGRQAVAPTAPESEPQAALKSAGDGGGGLTNLKGTTGTSGGTKTGGTKTETTTSDGGRTGSQLTDLGGSVGTSQTVTQQIDTAANQVIDTVTGGGGTTGGGSKTGSTGGTAGSGLRDDVGGTKGTLTGCEATHIRECGPLDQVTATGTVFVSAGDAAAALAMYGQSSDPEMPKGTPSGYYPCSLGYCLIGQGGTESGKGGGGTGGGGTQNTTTSTCNEQCPGSDGVLRSCTPPDTDGTSNDSNCDRAGRVEVCGNVNYCCPSAGGVWTTSMAACPTATVVGGACTEVQLFASTTGGYSTTPMTDAQKASLQIGDKIRIAITGSKAELKTRFRVYINNVVEATGNTASPEWRLGQAFSGTSHLTTYYSDYEIKKSGTYKFEGQVSTKP